MKTKTRLRLKFTLGGIFFALAIAPLLSHGAVINTGYRTNALVSSVPGVARHTDLRLINPWGIAIGPASVAVADNGTGLVTAHGFGTGVPSRRAIQVPVPAGDTNHATPTGLALNPTRQFVITNGTHIKPAELLIATEDGTISGWNPFGRTNATLLVDNSGAGAVYKGLALAFATNGPFLYAANFHAGVVEVYDTNFTLVTTFTDPTLVGFAPFNIRRIQDKLFVTFAKQDVAMHDDVAGAGNGYIRIFNTDGTLVRNFADQGALNAPWGMAVAPRHFGKFSHALLVGNFGDGTINAYNLLTGEFLGPLTNASGDPITISGLWGLAFDRDLPEDDFDFEASKLFFTAGINDEADGVFGIIRAIAPFAPPVH